MAHATGPYDSCPTVQCCWFGATSARVSSRYRVARRCHASVGSRPYCSSHASCACIEAHVPLSEAFAAARRWADGEAATLIAPSTGAVEAQPWLEMAGVEIGTSSNRHSRFSARPLGAVIGWCLNLEEVLEIESRSSVSSFVAVQALTFMRARGHELDPKQLIVEAIRQGWPGVSPLEFAGLARDLNRGKRLRFQNRLDIRALERWSSA